MTAPQLDLDHEISTQAEAAQNATTGIVGEAGGLSGQSVDRLSQKAQGKIKKAAALIKRAFQTSEAGDHVKGAQLAHKALMAAPELPLANQTMGLMLYRLGRLSKALEFFDRAWRMDPEDVEIYSNLGLVAWKLDMLDAAEKFYRIYREKNPGSAGGVINFSGVLRDQGKFDDAIEILRQAIYKEPENYEFWNSLGTVLMDSGQIEEARPFYAECMRLKPDFSRAYNNLGNVCDMLGDVEEAVDLYEKALIDPVNDNERATIAHSRSMALVASGRLKEGWDAYQVRLDGANPQATFFIMKNAEHWDGADLAQIRGKKVVLIGEQGLGDEVLFMNCTQDLIDAIGPDGQLMIACEQRLAPLVARSFPQAVVGNHLSSILEGRNLRIAPDFDKIADYWTPMADPLRALRSELKDFPRDRRGFLKPDPERREAFAGQLAAMGPGPKVGLLWKSLKMTAKRRRSFTAFETWAPILKTPGATFVNLQYGQVDEELEQAAEMFGVTIHQPQDIDLKMDLDGVAALSSACDLVIGPMNATTNIAAACGAEVWFTHAQTRPWTSLGADHNAWYPHCTSFFGKTYRDFDTIFANVAAALSERVKLAA